VVDVHWAVRAGPAGSPEVARHETMREPLSGLDSAEIAAGTSRALAALADRIVAELSRARVD
jgi:hypothetical protein